MFLTRGGSVRSKTPIRGKRGKKGGGRGNGNSGEPVGLGYGLKTPDIDVVSMLSNPGSSISGRSGIDGSQGGPESNNNPRHPDSLTSNRYVIFSHLVILHNSTQ